jgi:hypothetical protein
MMKINTIQILGFAASLLLIATGIYGIVLYGGQTAPSTEPLSTELLLHMILMVGGAVFAAIASIFLMFSFRNTPSPEVFFFIIAVQGAASGAVRPLISALINGGYAYSVPAFLTRLFHFGRFVSMLSVFISGLFAAGLALQRRKIMLSSIFFISFVLAAILPVDISRVTSSLLYSTGSELSMFLGFIIILLLSTGNYLIAALYQEDRNHYVVALGIFLLMCGNELLYRSSNTIVAGTGLLLMCGGAYFFGSSTHKIYLWL